MAVLLSVYISSLTTGPLLLGGWSFGGVVAYEVALQLIKRSGIKIKGIVLVDAPNPVERVPLSGAIIQNIARCNHKTNYAAEGIVDVPPWLADRSDPKTAIAGWADLTSCPMKVGYPWRPLPSLHALG
ncbi:hypothetical protein BT96DRAFT_988803 [Gymnopus androsaceus JB14]|uniref:Thioesterase domain-containing protein n=1 Tax=Gymnopus androsaceus JB14 TaxID=1447944 RepID=A0A6A4I8D0_9AGAR|nr:hypothetical protein BT96DRAFT_988803 [Gymnopus androsaceus JB14]